MKSTLILSPLLLMLPWSAIAFVLAPPTASRSSAAFWSPSSSHPVVMKSTSPLILFLGASSSSTEQQNKKEEKELARFTKLPADHESLTVYIQEWAALLAENKGKVLTTPVVVTTNEHGAKILFKPKATTYKSKNEERAAQEGSSDDNGDKPKKKKSNKEGGVEILVQQLENGEVQVQAKRCEMDEDTMIREMSEDAIIAGLKKAVEVWKKDRPN